MDKNTSNINKDDASADEQKIKISDALTKNTDPRANENLTEKQESSSGSEGVGSEITDGEAG